MSSLPDEGRIVFLTDPSSLKARNLDRDPRVVVFAIEHERAWMHAFG
jgi:hypothetical protein